MSKSEWNNYRRYLSRLNVDYSKREVLVESTYDDWFRSGLNISIPRAVINMIVVETVKRALKTELKNEINNTSRLMVINMIIIPLALALSLISLITTIVFYTMGAWVTSIPFLLSTIFGIYFFYLYRKRTKK